MNRRIWFVRLGFQWTTGHPSIKLTWGVECEGVRIRDCEGRKGAESKGRIVRIIAIKYLTSRLNQGKY